MKIGPIENSAQLAHWEAERERFRSAAAYVRSEPAPPDIMPYLWLASAEACEAVIEEIDAEIAAYQRRQRAA